MQMPHHPHSFCNLPTSPKHTHTIKKREKEMSTPPDTAHTAPSLPASPEHKRVKASVAPAFSSVAAAHPTANIDTAPPTLQIQRLSDSARLPTKGSAFAAGHDVYASATTTIPAKGRAL